MGKQFLDLLKQEPFKQLDVINSYLDGHGIEPANSAAEYSEIWRDLEIIFPYADSIIITGQEIRPLKKDKDDRSSNLLGLQLKRADQTSFSLTFAVSDNINGGYGLFNTKVSLEQISDFNPFAYYKPIMYLMRKVSNPGTPLTLYVRQRESREILEAGYHPSETPLVKVFTSAGWEYTDYQRMDNLSNEPNGELKKHKLTLINPEN